MPTPTCPPATRTSPTTGLHMCIRSFSTGCITPGRLGAEGGAGDLHAAPADVTGLSAYALLAASAFLSATLLPGSSEAVLLGLLAKGQGAPWMLVTVASVANVAGSVANWAIGRFGAGRAGSATPAMAARLDRARAWFARYGSWSLLLSWVPVIGDPLTLAAGLMRVPFWQFLILVTAGKAFRYAAVVLAWGGWGLA